MPRVIGSMFTINPAPVQINAQPAENQEGEQTAKTKKTREHQRKSSVVPGAPAKRCSPKGNLIKGMFIKRHLAEGGFLPTPFQPGDISSRTSDVAKPEKHGATGYQDCQDDKD